MKKRSKHACRKGSQAYFSYFGVSVKVRGPQLMARLYPHLIHRIYHFHFHNTGCRDRGTNVILTHNLHSTFSASMVLRFSPCVRHAYRRCTLPFPPVSMHIKWERFVPHSILLCAKPGKSVCSFVSRRFATKTLQPLIKGLQ